MKLFKPTDYIFANAAGQWPGLQGLCQHIRQARAKAIDVYKDDATSAVFSIVLGDKRVVVKHHKTRSWLFALKNACRPSRAAKNRYFAKRLEQAGIQTFEVLATVEQRLGPFRGESFVVMNYIPGQDALSVFGYQQKKQALWEPAARHIVLMMKQLAKAKLRHRDLNLSNIKLVGDQPFLLDLDGMRAPICWGTNVSKHDEQRFLENWAEKEYAAVDARALFEKLCREL